MIRLVIVVSTAGSVMNQLLHNPFFKSRVHAVISDRECPAIARADRHGVATVIFPDRDKEKFSESVRKYLRSEQADYAISFYTKLFVGELLNEYRDRIVNLHPSLLPSFKGMHAFDDAVRYGVQFVGSTIHFIDENMDEGKIIQQTVCRVDNSRPIAETRHRVFEQQCRSLLQVVKWLEEDRILVEGHRVAVRDSAFGDAEFSPNLDFAEAIELEIPKPAKVSAGT